MKWTMSFALLGILGAAPAFAQARPEPPAQVQVEHGGERHGAHVERLAARLGLDAAGTAKLRATLDGYRAQMRPIWQDARATRQALQAELASGQPDEGKVSALTDQLGSDRQELAALAQERAAALKETLTPTQYATLMLRDHHFGRGHHGHDRERK